MSGAHRRCQAAAFGAVGSFLFDGQRFDFGLHGLNPGECGVDGPLSLGKRLVDTGLGGAGLGVLFLEADDARRCRLKRGAGTRERLVDGRSVLVGVVERVSRRVNGQRGGRGRRSGSNRGRGCGALGGRGPCKSLRGGGLSCGGIGDRLRQVHGLLGFLAEFRHGGREGVGRRRRFDGGCRGDKRWILGGLVGQRLLGGHLGDGHRGGRGLFGGNCFRDGLFGACLCECGLARQIVGGHHDRASGFGGGQFGLQGLLGLLNEGRLLGGGLFGGGDLRLHLGKGVGRRGHGRLKGRKLLRQRVGLALSGGQQTLNVLETHRDGRRVDGQVADTPPVLGVPHANLAIPVGTDHLGFVVREDGFERQVAKRFKIALLAAVLVPEAHDVVAPVVSKRPSFANRTEAVPPP